METPPTISPPPPVAQPDSNEKLLIILCHLSLFLGVGLIFPLVIYLVKKAESEKIAAHAREALNFHISLFIYGLISFLLCAVFIGFFCLLALAVLAVVLPIVAAAKAAEGNFYRYPLCIRLVN